MEEAIESRPIVNQGLVKRLKYLIGLLDGDELDCDEYAAKAITIMENLGIGLLITRRGYHQNRRDYTFQDFTWKNNLVRIILIIVGIRITVIALAPSDNQLITLYLANPFHDETHSQTVAILALLIVAILGVLREMAIYLEETGAIMDLQFLRTIQLYGFNPKLLFLTHNQCKPFKRILIFHVVNWTRMMRFNQFANGAIMLSFRLVDPLFYTNTIYAVTSIFWIVSETIVARMIFTGLLNVGGVTIAMVPWYLYRLKSVHELTLKVASKKVINGPHLERLNYRLLYYLNCFDKIMADCRYLFFQCIFMVSFLADTVIFLAIEADFPTQITGTFYFAGFFCITAIGGVIYYGGAFVDLPDEIFNFLVKIVHRSKAGLEEKLVTHKILDRIGIYGTGARIGDVIHKMEKDLFVYYILENASTIMLLICTIRSN